MNIETLHEWMIYDPLTGEIKWRKAAGNNTIPAGTLVGHITNKGYWRTTFRKERLLVHKIAWALYYGEWPLFDIDHKDAVRSNNKIENLRKADAQLNAGNKKPKPGKKYKGVYYNPKTNKYYAQIKINGENQCLGNYVLIEDAAEAYLKAAKRFFGEFARSV